jgi:hypothetical protein
VDPPEHEPGIPQDQRDQISHVLDIVDDEHRSRARRGHLVRVCRLIVDGAVEAVCLDMLLARADAGSNGRRGILDAETCQIGTERAQPIGTRIGPGECHGQRGGVARHAFGRFYELVELAFVGARPFHHPSGTMMDGCDMFQRTPVRHRHAPTR